MRALIPLPPILARSTSQPRPSMYLKQVCRRIGSCALVLSIVIPCLAASPQDGDAGGGGRTQDPPPEEGESIGTTPVFSATKSAPRPARVTVPLGNVGTEDVHSLLRGVESMTREVFVCPDCPSVQREEAGACPDCGAVLVRREPQEVVSDASISIDRNKLAITLHLDRWVGLAKLSATFAETGAKIRTDAFKLPAFCRILVSDVDHADGPRLRAGLIESKLFPAVAIVSDADPKQLWIVPEKGDEAVTFGALQQLLSKLVTTARVSDVQWTTPCYTCNSKGSIRGSCPKCWPSTPQPK